MSKTSRLSAINIQSQIKNRLSLTDREAVDAAISDVLISNSFLVNVDEDAPTCGGPYTLNLSDEEGRLGFDVFDEAGDSRARLLISLAPFRRQIKDYLFICDSYYTAIREGAPHQIEAIDMARRSIHDEAAELLKDRLKNKITVDFDTARRLFTLLSVLKMVGT